MSSGGRVYDSIKSRRDWSKSSKLDPDFKGETLSTVVGGLMKRLAQTS